MPTTFRCISCENKPEFTKPGEIVDHLLLAHGLKRPLKYIRRPTLFLDGEKSYHEQHATLTFGDIEVSEIWSSR